MATRSPRARARSKQPSPSTSTIDTAPDSGVRYTKPAETAPAPSSFREGLEKCRALATDIACAVEGHAPRLGAEELAWALVRELRLMEIDLVDEEYLELRRKDREVHK